MKKNPGRPFNSKKNGKKSALFKFRILQTKTWAWTCSKYLQRDNEQPPTTYYLSQQSTKVLAGTYPASIKDKDGNIIYIDDEEIDPSRWQRWLEGKRTIPIAGGFRYIKNKDNITVKKIARTTLWPETHSAYEVGPKVQDGYVPLWHALSGRKNNEILNQWSQISMNTWQTWGPDYDPTGEHNCDDSSEHLPNQLDDLIDLERFASYLAWAPKTPPLLALSAAITVARINGDKEVFLFEPKDIDMVGYRRQPKHNHRNDYSLSARLRNPIIMSLSKIKITLSDIIEVAQEHDLIIHDCGSLTYQEYKNLRWTSHEQNFERAGYFKNYDFSTHGYVEENIKEKAWRDFFGT